MLCRFTNLIQTPFNNRVNVAIMITESTNLVKSQTRTHIINAATFIILKNKQTDNGIKNTLGIILFFPV